MKAVLATLAAAGLAVVGFSTTASGHSTKHSRHAAQLGRQLLRRVSTEHTVSGVFVPARQGANSQTFTDPNNDAVNDAPDVATVDVANDDAGNISVTISFSNRFSDLKDNDGFEVIMNTDQNAATGSGGFDYIYVGIKDRNGLFAWSGSGFTRASANSLHGTSGAGKAGFTINRADLGNPTVLRFWVTTTRDLGDNFGDDAPDAGVYVYSLGIAAPPTTTTTTTTTTTPPPPPSTTTTTTPPPPPAKPKFVAAGVGTPHPGKRFVVRTRIALGDLSATPSSLGCIAKVGAAPIRTAVRKAAPFATCTLTVPVGSKGKTLVIVLKIHYKAAVVTRILRFRIT